MSDHSDRPGSREWPAENTPDESFNEKLMKKIRGQQTLKDYLFMFIVGFRRVLEGFFRFETIQHLPEPDRTDPLNKNPKE